MNTQKNRSGKTWFKQIRFGAAAVLILALFAAMALPAVAAEPTIVFKDKEINLPEAREGQILKAVFKFSNKGDMNLIVDDVSPSCGCTASSFTKVTKPGETGEITLTLDTEGITGYYRKTAVVSTNDPKAGFITLVMLGQTKSSIKLDTGRRIKLKGCLGQEVAATAKLSDPEGKPLLITGLENPMSDYLSASLKPEPGGKVYSLNLKSLSKEPADFAGPLFLKLANGTKVSVYVVVDVKGPIWVQPHELYLGAVTKSGGLKRRHILVKKECTDKLTLDDLQYSKKYFKVKTIWEDKEAKLFLEISPNLEEIPLGAFKQNIIIKASGDEMKVRVSGIVRE